MLALSSSAGSTPRAPGALEVSSTASRHPDIQFKSVIVAAGLFGDQGVTRSSAPSSASARLLDSPEDVRETDEASSRRRRRRSTRMIADRGQSRPLMLGIHVIIFLNPIAFTMMAWASSSSSPTTSPPDVAAFNSLDGKPIWTLAEMGVLSTAASSIFHQPDLRRDVNDV
jgi:hypothetical protein